MVLSDKLICYLFGNDFDLAILAFAILIWDTPLLMYTSICGNFTTAMKIEKKAAWVYGCEAIFNILLNLLLIPRYGLLAASVVTVATEFVGTVMFYRIFRKEFGAGLGSASLLRMIISSVIMGAAIFLLRGINIFVLVLIGLVVYLVISWVLRVLTPVELELLFNMFKRIKAMVLRRVNPGQAG